MNEALRDPQLDLGLTGQESRYVDRESEGDNERAFSPANVEVEPYTTNIYNIIARIDNDELDLMPSFERNPNLWSGERQSQLIESLILKIPLPTFYFTSDTKVDENGVRRTVWHVVDGLQRLCAVFNFISDKAKKKLELEGMEYLKNLNGLRFSELPAAYRRNILEAQIITYLIRPGSDDAVKFNIFKRVNRGGVPLNQQEIRHALHQGGASDYLGKLAALQTFKEATYKKFSAKRMVDREVINRFLAFYLCRYNLCDYTSMDAFLDGALKKIDGMKEWELEGIQGVFESAMSAIHKSLGHYAFRRMNVKGRGVRASVNKAIFEALSVAIALRSEKEREQFANSSSAMPLYEGLFADKSPEGLEAVIGTSTGHRWNIQRRYEIFDEYVANVTGAGK